jgi:hypothetical protein
MKDGRSLRRSLTTAYGKVHGHVVIAGSSVRALNGHHENCSELLLAYEE